MIRRLALSGYAQVPAVVVVVDAAVAVAVAQVPFPGGQVSRNSRTRGRRSRKDDMIPPSSGNPNREIAIIPSSLERAVPSSSSCHKSHHPAVGVEHHERTPSLPEHTFRILGERDPGEASLSTQWSTPPRLITPIQANTSQHAAEDRHPLDCDPQMAAHYCLVQRISRALSEKAKAQSGEIQSMDEESQDNNGEEKLFDEDMPLALIVKDAKQEAVARRALIKNNACPKKGRVIADKDDS
ncbi:hypothetical protein J5N97_016307 [Dioscorea zingiberensis]|uniref:Uncharacterized protein n=1 Tax=Dioscorea zingiberensis TaxID=325984 RepID=A0A9D5HFJ5_9LILI|nr:hypothetical protein J5N97_016307 [Dioscorea zingiberensis]